MAETKNSSEEMSDEVGEQESYPMCHAEKFKVTENTGELLNMSV